MQFARLDDDFAASAYAAKWSGGCNIASVAVFDFIDFARGIYAENSDACEDRYLLPALYGGEIDHGETGGRFKALVVLEAPSVSFTKDRWTQCATIEDAITRHREIFFEWAFIEPQADLFRSLVGKPSTVQDFFRRLYITDVWKDAAFKENLKRSNPDYRGYGRYWRSKLELEIKKIATERIIFIGEQARSSGYHQVPPGTPVHCLDFPSWRNKTFKAGVQQLIADIHGAHVIR